MRAIRLGAVWLLVWAVASCSTSSKGTSETILMPDVTGRTLDLALDDIKAAGFGDKVDVIGGGTFGVVNESNWQVCEQSPGPGQPIAATPRLSVERSCDAVTTPPSTQPTSDTSTQGSSTTEVLNVENNHALAELLMEPEPCADTVAAFATDHHGQAIEFDGNIAAMSGHGDSQTRYDILIVVGNFSPTVQVGPTFQFMDVGMFDLHLSGSNIPDSIGVGTNLRIRATVVSFESNSCLFFLDPVSTEVR